MNKVLFYFDCVSPWSYVAFQMVRRYQKMWDLDVTYKPVNLGYIMKYSGNKPPISVANKGTWMWEERDRAAKFYGVTLNPTKTFPINTQWLQAVLRELADTAPETMERAMAAGFAAIWHDDRAVATRDDIRAIVTSAALVPPSQTEAFLDKAMSDDAKSRLQAEAKPLVEDQLAFGMPYLIITRASDSQTVRWFGSDRFEQIAAWLDKPYKGPFADGSVPKL